MLVRRWWENRIEQQLDRGATSWLELELVVLVLLLVLWRIIVGYTLKRRARHACAAMPHRT